MSGLSAIMGAAKYLPASAGLKLLEKFNPKFKNYFASAAAYGFDANNALDYLSQRFQNDQSQNFESRLEQGQSKGTLRPDEAVAKSQLANAALPGKVLKSAAAYGGAALLGGPAGVAAQAGADALGAIPKASSSARLPDQSLHGPFEQGPQQGQMGPFRQGHEAEHGPFQKQLPKGEHGPFQQKQASAVNQPQATKAQPKDRAEALTRYSEMNKKKKLIDQLTQEFEQDYGAQGLMQSPTVPQQPQSIQQNGQQRNSGLLQMTQEGLNLLRNLKR